MFIVYKYIILLLPVIFTAGRNLNKDPITVNKFQTQDPLPTPKEANTLCIYYTLLSKSSLN